MFIILDLEFQYNKPSAGWKLVYNHSDMGELSGKLILITGAAQRIGRALALALARAGADVIVHYSHSQAQAESARQEIQVLGRRAYLIQADLGDPQQVQAVFDQALMFGTVSGLVNNAAIFEPLDWQSTRLEDWQRHLMVNLTAPFLLCQAFARALPENETGRILNLLDWRALRPGSDHLPYTVSKAALAGLTRSLALAFAPRITVNGLALGAILPPSDGGDASGLIRSTPARRWAMLEEVEQAALFLLSGPAYITGEIMHVDGGRHLV